MNTIFAIVDPTSEEQPALARAVQIASKTGARVLAFLCVYKPLEELGDALSARDGKHRHLEKSRNWLAGQLKPYSDQGVAIEPEIYWNEKWYESTVFASAKCNADLVVKSVSHHRSALRKLFKTSDYMLMRHSASPVLLVPVINPWSCKRLVAALDLESTHRGHQRLNDLVMSTAKELARHFDISIYLLSVATAHDGFAHLQGDEDVPGLEELVGERYASYVLHDIGGTMYPS